MSFALSFFLMVAAGLIAAAGSNFLLRRRRRKLATQALEDASTPYGVELASLVADRLEGGDTLTYGHRDYCGMGLRFAGAEYIYDCVVDGQLPSTTELREWKDSSSPERRVFSTRTAFVEWLAPLTDNDLSGEGLESEFLRGNQRITRRRLTSFTRGEPASWN